MFSTASRGSFFWLSCERLFGGPIGLAEQGCDTTPSVTDISKKPVGRAQRGARLSAGHVHDRRSQRDSQRLGSSR